MITQLAQTFARLVSAGLGVDIFRGVDLGGGRPGRIRGTEEGGIDEKARWVAVDASANLQPKCRHRRKLIGRGHAAEAQFEFVFE